MSFLHAPLFLGLTNHVGFVGRIELLIDYLHFCCVLCHLDYHFSYGKPELIGIIADKWILVFKIRDFKQNNVYKVWVLNRRSWPVTLSFISRSVVSLLIFHFLALLLTIDFIPCCTGRGPVSLWQFKRDADMTWIRRCHCLTSSLSHTVSHRHILTPRYRPRHRQTDRSIDRREQCDATRRDRPHTSIRLLILRACAAHLPK